MGRHPIETRDLISVVPQVTVASVMGILGAPRMSMLYERRARQLCFISITVADYNASKAAVISLSETLRFELDNQCVTDMWCPAANSHLIIPSYKAPGIRTTVVCPGHILTPLFSTLSVPQSRLYQFFFPSIQPIDVVKPIITALDEQQSETIMVPFYTQLVPFLKLLPSFMIDLAQYVSTLLGCFTRARLRPLCIGCVSHPCDVKLYEDQWTARG